MTHSTDENGGISKVEAKLVADHERIGTLPRHFGAQMMVFERKVYGFMSQFVAEYRGAFWDFFNLTNEGFYMAPRLSPVVFRVHSNGYEGQMSADAAGVTVCLFALSHLSFQRPDEDVFAQHFYRLREFALEHQEVSAIFAAID